MPPRPITRIAFIIIIIMYIYAVFHTTHYTVFEEMLSTADKLCLKLQNFEV
jgi:hypothetical protein